MTGRRKAAPAGHARGARGPCFLLFGTGSLSDFRRALPGRGIRPLFLASAAALLLSGCAVQPPPEGGGPAAEGQSSAIAITGNGGADRAAPGGASATDGTSAAASSGAETAALPPELSSLDRLKGMKGGEIASLLGPPDLIRHDGPAEVWQYVAHDCVLDLFLYRPQGAAAHPAQRRTDRAGNGAADESQARDDAGPDHRVVYYELRGRDGSSSAGAECFGALVATSRARRSG